MVTAEKSIAAKAMRKPNQPVKVKRPAHPPKHRDAEGAIVAYLDFEQLVRSGDVPLSGECAIFLLKEDLYDLTRPMILNLRVLMGAGLHDQAICRILYRQLKMGTLEFSPVSRKTAARFVKSAVMTGYLEIHRAEMASYSDIGCSPEAIAETTAVKVVS